MVRIRHFEFCCCLQGVEPTLDRFRACYQFQCNLGLYYFTTCGAKKLLINPPKSYHD
ncbi:hypothetical protein Hanom_Chr08g00745011 [Helianthus anomalus]